MHENGRKGPFRNFPSLALPDDRARRDPIRARARERAPPRFSLCKRASARVAACFFLLSDHVLRGESTCARPHARPNWSSILFATSISLCVSRKSTSAPTIFEYRIYVRLCDNLVGLSLLFRILHITSQNIYLETVDSISMVGLKNWYVHPFEIHRISKMDLQLFKITGIIYLHSDIQLKYYSLYIITNIYYLLCVWSLES